MTTADESEYQSLARRLQETPEDQDAWARLFRRYWPFVVGVCSQRLGGSGAIFENARDTAQQVFFRLASALHARRLEMPDSEETFRGLLAVMASNQARDLLRRRHRQRRDESRQVPLGDLELADQSPAVDAALETADFLEHLVRHLDSLDQRILWRLLERRSISAIAAELHISTKTVLRRSDRIRRHYHKLRRQAFDAGAVDRDR